ncbi:MAG: hypothetical protein SVX43_18770 [Cyanobacteriota bacterium]|nr:hypothetical protein [Cyanobacteriota bacterium]
MRSYGHKTDRLLKKDGENLSGVLYHLCQDSTLKQRILEFIQSLPEQDIKDIEFIETPREEVMLQLIETFGGVSSPCEGSSQLVRLRDLPDYPELIARGSVGYLMTRGLLEQFVKHHPGSEQKKKKAKEWLASIRQGVEIGE